MYSFGLTMFTNWARGWLDSSMGFGKRPFGEIELHVVYNSK